MTKHTKISASSSNTIYSPRFQKAFLHPRYWGTWLGIGAAALLAYLPFRMRDKLAIFLAKKIVKMDNRAKKRAVVNIAYCFPEKSEQERQKILEETYIIAGCIMLGIATTMMRSKSYIEAHTVFHNESIITDLVKQGRNIILLAPHSWPIDYAAVQLASRGLPLAAMIKKQANPVVDWLMNLQRNKYGGRIHERKDGIKPFIKSVRDGYLGYYLPDEDHGPDLSVFVPFLGTEKATLSGLGKLARLSKATVVPLMPIYNRKTGNFEVLIQAPLANFPTGDEHKDARIMNERIEIFIRQDPAQYMWIMNLLRSRPDGTQLY